MLIAADAAVIDASAAWRLRAVGVRMSETKHA